MCSWQINDDDDDDDGVWKEMFSGNFEDQIHSSTAKCMQANCSRWQELRITRSSSKDLSEPRRRRRPNARCNQSDSLDERAAKRPDGMENSDG